MAAQDIGAFASYSTYGTAGLIDMPAAVGRPDSELAFTTSHFVNQTRNTLSFQITPRLAGSFRYALLYDVRPADGGAVLDFIFDRSFSLQYLLADEGRYRPAIAIGLNDFLGTGIYSSEYLVASKRIGPSLRFTGGIGWGRLGGVGGFANPLGAISSHFSSRPGVGTAAPGKLQAGNWFRGNAALFGGVEWQATDKLTLLAEYSSDAYPSESPSAFQRKSPFNFGVKYQARPGILIGAHYLYGSQFGAFVSFAFNPKKPPAYGGLDKAPPSVVLRSARETGPTGNLEARAGRALAGAGVRLHGLKISGRSARIEIENETFSATAQAVGRTARALSGVLPRNVEVLEIVLVSSGIAGSQITLQRSDLEELEHELDNSWQSYTRAQISAAPPLHPSPARYPAFDWAAKPYLSPSLFDPDQPVRADLGLELSAKYEPAPGFVFSGVLRQKAIGNLNKSTRPSTSVLPHVRSDFNIYEKQGNPALTELTGAYYFTPSAQTYGRITAGYLEPMFGGVSAELLWKPVSSRIALGAEINVVQQRDFDQLFGFRDYGVTTGHVSAYWDMGMGYHSQLDVGRFLAGDWGATYTLDREFKNGWKVGGFVTLTNVSFSDFGEGSFDKGLRFTVPIDWLSGNPTQDKFSTVIRPVTRDGGARLNVSGRLYDKVRPMHEQGLRDSWGRFWR
ncbi:MAG: YjbH domain-containing protein [Paracoccaceae bacterium]